MTTRLQGLDVKSSGGDGFGLTNYDKLKQDLDYLVVPGANLAALGASNTFAITSEFHRVTVAGGNNVDNLSDVLGAAAGQQVRLWFDNAQTIRNNGAGTGNIRTKSGSDRAVVANEIVTFVFDGTYWREQSSSPTIPSYTLATLPKVAARFQQALITGHLTNDGLSPWARFCTYRDDVNATYPWLVSDKAAVISTTLNGAITNAAGTLVVTSAAGFPSAGNFILLIDSEEILVTAVSGTTFTLTRGYNGTTAAAHANGATVYWMLAGPMSYVGNLNNYGGATTSVWANIVAFNTFPGGAIFSKVEAECRITGGPTTSIALGSTSAGHDLCSASGSNTNVNPSATTDVTITVGGGIWLTYFDGGGTVTAPNARLFPRAFGGNV